MFAKNPVTNPARAAKTLAGLLALTFAPLLLACDGETRNEPSPREMCQALARECAELSNARSRACYDVGRAGMKNRRDEDQCFAYYPDCIDECIDLSSNRPSANDADSAKPRDAGKTNDRASEENVKDADAE
jgi:hypothetical protein